MLARSITKCYHSFRLATPSVLPLTRSRCSSFNFRSQSSFTSPPPPDVEISGDNDDDDVKRPNVTNTTPPLPPHPTALHHDLPTFLAHAHRTTLSPTATTYVGTYYEYTVQHTLRRLAFHLQRTGGRGDAGIDHLGTWHLPHGPSGLVPQPLRVLVQCKALKAKLGPNLIRELEGAFVGAPAGYRGQGVVGVLVSPREATKGVRDAMGRSRWPMVWVMLEVLQQSSGEGRVRQVLWNKAAGDVGLEGLDVTVRYGLPVEAGGGDEVGKECVLMWQGRPLPGLEEKEESVKG